MLLIPKTHYLVMVPQSKIPLLGIVSKFSIFTGFLRFKQFLGRTVVTKNCIMVQDTQNNAKMPTLNIQVKVCHNNQLKGPKTIE